MSFFFPSVSSTSSVPSASHDPAAPQNEDGRAIQVVPRSRWVKKTDYDPSRPLLEQIQENEEKKGSLDTKVSRFTKVRIGNLVFSIYTDTPVPYANSDYSINVYLDRENKQVTFGPLGRDNQYRTTFDCADDLERFFKDRVEAGELVSADDFKEAKIEADEQYKQENEQIVSMMSGMLGGMGVPRRSAAGALPLY